MTFNPRHHPCPPSNDHSIVTQGSPQFTEWQERYFTVATEVKQKVNAFLGDYLVEFHGAKVHFIGSCAVRGLCGKEMLDFAIVTKGFLPNVPDTAIASLPVDTRLSLKLSIT